MFHGFQLLFVLLCRLTFRINPCHFFFSKKYVRDKEILTGDKLSS